MTETIALMPLKAHSARVKSKNFRIIAGKPLFRWTLDALMRSKNIDSVVINTDARNLLAENNLHHGDYSGRIIIRDRSKELCGDFTSMNLILEDDINHVPSDVYFMTHTTNPLISTKTIDWLLDEFSLERSKGRADSIFTVDKHRTRFYKEDGSPINHDPTKLVRTQDLPPYLEENSVAYLFTSRSFESTRARIGSAPKMLETPPLESVDIDEPSDWFMAESLLMRIAAGEQLPEFSYEQYI